MNEFTKIYVNGFRAGANKKSAELQVGLADASKGKPSVLAMLVEKIRMKGLPERLQVVAPAAGIGAGVGGLSAMAGEAFKSDEDRMADEFAGNSPGGNIAKGILGGAATGAMGGVAYTAGRDGSLINPV